MGNIQQFCGSNCISEDLNEKKTERNMPERDKSLNDYQELCLIKAIKALKRIQKEKKDPFSTNNLTKKIKILDEFIEEKRGKFVDLKTFENSINVEIYNLYYKLAIREKKLGLISFENKSIEPFEENNSEENQLNFLILRKPVLLEDGDMYLGYWNLQGEKQGYGKLIKNDGILIEGYWESNGTCKYGRYFFANGTYYEGNLENNLPNAIGELKLFENDIYSGEWLDGEYHGKGFIYLSNKLKYQGEFYQSKFSGEGNLTFSDIDEYNYSYKGSFINCKFEGKGHFTLFKNRKSEIEGYKGLWKNGLPYGKGNYYWKSGNTFEGLYEEGKKEGNGKYIFNSGKSYYEGIWSNGKPNGKGYLKLENNLIISAVWKQGKIQKIDNFEDLEKINNDQSLLDFSIENEMFTNDFYLDIKYITPTKENPKEIYFDENNGKIKYTKALKVLSNGIGKIIKKEIEKNGISA